MDWLGNDQSLNIGDNTGPQTDGTYSYPSAAIQTNDPSNTAGYSASTPAWVGDVLKSGVGVLGQYFQQGQMLDYRRFEATAGGLYRQGYPALLSRNGQAQVNSPLLIALILGGVFLLARK